jgi:hypothetical protein
MYAAGQPHPLRDASAQVVRLVRDGQLDGVISAEVVVHVATCLEHGLDTIVSPDRGLDFVTEVRRVDPARLNTTANSTRSLPAARRDF